MRRYALRAFFGLVGLAVIATLLACISALTAMGPLRNGINELNASVAAIHNGTKDEAVADLTTASQNFSLANDHLKVWWAKPAEFVPGVREHLGALRAAANVGAEVAVAGARLEPDVSLNGVSFGPALLSRLQLLESSLETTQAILTTAENQLSSARSGWLISPVASRLSKSLSTIQKAQQDTKLARDAVATASDLLGKDGPRRYFLAIETEAELRGNGGVLGNYGLISTKAGHLSLTQFGRDTDLNAAGNVGHRRLTSPAQFLTQFGYLQPKLYWQNVLASPDFPQDASVVEQLYPQTEGGHLNGVIAVDPDGLADLLSLIGPISVPGWPTPITAENAPEILLHQEYDNLSGNTRVAFLGTVAAAVWGKFTERPLPGLSTLARVFASAITEKHLVIASTSSSTESDLQALGAAGIMAQPKGSDFLAVINTNTGGNKIDYYLRRTIDYSVRLSSQGAISATVTVHLRNLAPSAGQPAYVIGSAANPSTPFGINQANVSIYSPWVLDTATVNGKATLLVTDNEEELETYTALVRIPPGGETTIVAHLSGQLPLNDTYRLELYRQPTVTPDTVNVQISAPTDWSFGSSSSMFHRERNSLLAHLQLNSNQQIYAALVRP